MVTITGKNRIDTHVHVVLNNYVAAIEKAGGDPSGWVAPHWSAESAIEMMTSIGVAKQVLSVTSPGPAVAGTGKDVRDLTRKLNDEQAEIVKAHPDNFDFFASTPSWVDVEGTLAEIEYGLKTLKAAGVVAMTSYSDKLLGDAAFQPIWDKLDELKAIVFIHPASVDIKPKNIAGCLPQPTIDYPIQTTRTAVDLVLTKTVLKHPNVKIILSHGGGALPFLSDRVIKSLDIPLVQQKMQISPSDALKGFQSYWLDTAVSSSPAQLLAMLAFTSPDKILFGSDWPYAPDFFGQATTEQLDEFAANDPKGHLLAGVNSTNAKKLFGWA